MDKAGHGKPFVGREMVLEALDGWLGPISDLRQMTEGEDSQAFSFAATGRGLVARVNRGRTGFDKDALIHRTFAHSLPVPEVLGIGQLGDVFLCVSARLSGETLQALPAGGALPYGRAVAQVMDAIAGSDVSGFQGFGPFDAEGHGRCQSWDAFLREPLEWDWSAAGGVPEKELDALSRLSGECAGAIGLVHGDFGSNNLLVASGRVSGVIDWSEAMIGDPAFDTANILFWRDWLDCMEQQCRFFEREEPGRLRDVERLTCYKLRIGLATWWEAAQAGDARTADWAAERCQWLAGPG